MTIDKHDSSVDVVVIINSSLNLLTHLKAGAQKNTVFGPEIKNTLLSASTTQTNIILNVFFVLCAKIPTWNPFPTCSMIPKRLQLGRNHWLCRSNQRLIHFRMDTQSSYRRHIELDFGYQIRIE